MEECEITETPIEVKLTVKIVECNENKSFIEQLIASEMFSSTQIAYSLPYTVVTIIHNESMLRENIEIFKEN